jgi:SAM-dependent methyltransferase
MRGKDRVKDKMVIAARSLPAPLKALAKRMLQVFDPLVVRLFRLRHGYSEPIPPVRLRARVGTPLVGDFVRSGAATVEALQEACGSAQRQLGDFRAVLDFGCGCGRVLTAMGRSTSTANARLVGSDVDPECVAWIDRAHPELEAVVNGFMPSLPFGSGEFDLVYSVSVLTHLDEPAQFAWLREIRRVLTADGLALLSVHGPQTYEMFRHGRMVSNSRDCARRMSRHGDLADEGFVFETYDRNPWNDADFGGVDGEYGLTFHSRDYIERAWAPIFQIRDVAAPPQMKGWQDIVVVSPASAAA